MEQKGRIPSQHSQPRERSLAKPKTTFRRNNRSWGKTSAIGVKFKTPSPKKNCCQRLFSRWGSKKRKKKCKKKCKTRKKKRTKKRTKRRKKRTRRK